MDFDDAMPRMPSPSVRTLNGECNDGSGRAHSPSGLSRRRARTPQAVRPSMGPLHSPPDSGGAGGRGPGPSSAMGRRKQRRHDNDRFLGAGAKVRVRARMLPAMACAYPARYPCIARFERDPKPHLHNVSHKCSELGGHPQRVPLTHALIQPFCVPSCLLAYLVLVGPTHTSTASCSLLHLSLLPPTPLLAPAPWSLAVLAELGDVCGGAGRAAQAV